MILEILEEARELLKDMAKLLNNYATLILVVITALYAYFTYKMAKTMSRQVIADIQVSNIVLGSYFLEKWFIKELEKSPETIIHSSFRFNLLFDARNKSSGSGSIDKPILILRFTNDNFEYSIFPTTKHTEWEKIDDIMSKGITTDFGGTIFLRGGESQKTELKYWLSDFGDDLTKHIKENFDSLEYYIKFNDNLGKEYLIKIEDIRPESEVQRK